MVGINYSQMGGQNDIVLTTLQMVFLGTYTFFCRPGRTGLATGLPTFIEEPLRRAARVVATAPQRQAASCGGEAQLYELQDIHFLAVAMFLWIQVGLNGDFCDNFSIGF